MAWEQSLLENKWASRRMMLLVTLRHLNPDTLVYDNSQLVPGQKKKREIISVISYFSIRHTELPA